MTLRNTLTLAAKEGFTDLVRYLFDHGASATDRFAREVLDIAKTNLDIDMIEFITRYV